MLTWLHKTVKKLPFSRSAFAEAAARHRSGIKVALSESKLKMFDPSLGDYLFAFLCP